MSLLSAAGTAPALSWSVLGEGADLDALRPDWLGLMARSGANEAMLTPDWLQVWWRVFGPLQGRRLCVGLFRRGGRLVGLAPLLKRRHWYRPALPFRRLEFLASGEAEADAICSDYLNVIAERGAEAAVAAAFAEAAAAGAFGRWDEVLLPMMAGDGPMPGLLAAAFDRAGHHAEVTQTGAAPYIPLPATWDAYLRRLSPGSRALVKQSLRRFEEWAGVEARLERATSSEELQRGKETLIALHHRRWSGDPGGGGVFRSPRFNAFHDAVLPRLLERGGLELLWLTGRGRPLAALYNLVWDNKVYFYQSGRATDVPPALRPGIVVLALAIRTAIEAGRREFDFLNGAARYKTQLALATRPVVQVRVARRSLAEGARRLFEFGVAGLRRVRDGWRRLAGRRRGA